MAQASQGGITQRKSQSCSSQRGGLQCGSRRQHTPTGVHVVAMPAPVWAGAGDDDESGILSCSLLHRMCMGLSVTTEMAVTRSCCCLSNIHFILKAWHGLHGAACLSPTSMVGSLLVAGCPIQVPCNCAPVSSLSVADAPFSWRRACSICLQPNLDNVRRATPRRHDW